MLEKVDLSIFSIEFLIPTVFSMLFRSIGLGHKGQGRVALGFGMLILYLLLVPSALIDSMGYGGYTHIAYFVIIVGSASVLIYSSDGPEKTIFLHIIQANMVAAVFALCNMVRYILGLSYPTLLLMLLFVSLILFLVALRFWVYPLRFITDTIQSDWKTMIEISAITLVLVMILTTYPSLNFDSHSIYFNAIIISIELCFFLFLYVFYRNSRKIIELSEAVYRKKLLNKSVEAMRMELAAREELLLYAVDSRRDLRYHNSQIMEYLESGDIEGATSYLRTYEARISEPTLLQYCQNPVANAMLHMYVHIARSEEISCTIETVIPEALPFNEEEICILLGNLLENACDSCRRTEKGINKILTVSARVDDIYLLLEIKNTAVRTVQFDDQGLPLPVRPGGGFKTRSVVEMIKKHGDMIRYQQVNGIFAVQLMIHL